AGDRVTDRVNARNAAGEMSIDNDAAAVVAFDAHDLEPQAVGVGYATDRNQHHVGFDRLGGAAGDGLDLRLELLASRLDGRELRGELERHALALEDALDLLADFGVDAGQDAIEELDHQHLRAESPPHRAELKADDAGAHHEETRRHLVQTQRAGRGHDALFVDVDTVQFRNIGPGGDHDRLGIDGLRLALGGRDLDFARRENFSGSLKCIDLVLLEQERDALDVALDAFVLELHHAG